MDSQPEARPATSARPEIASARRIVVKVGTRVLTQSNGRLALSRLFEVVEALVNLSTSDREPLLVTSGAVGLGRDALRLAHAPAELSERQACAAIGQSRLMALYQEGFAHLGVLCAQVLLTEADFDDRTRYLNLRATLRTLLSQKVVPIINENDVVATNELAFLPGTSRPVFGDNDKLSALVASKVGTDLLVLLTDVDGVFDEDPRKSKQAKLIGRVDHEHLEAELSGSSSGVGRGGMRSKVEAATIASRSGCHVVIASGLRPGVLGQVLRGEEVGTWFPARGGLSARQRWVAFATSPRGVLHLDEGAVRALVERGASLLAPGVTAIEGEFARGDVVELRGPQGEVVGRGVVSLDAAAALSWSKGEAPEGLRHHDALVHHDDLVLDEEKT